MATSDDVFQRLIGLETEYALAVSPAWGESVPNRYELFRQLVAALKRIIPAVEARHMKEGVFHAGGGAVWFETERPAAGGGLVEGATPECRSPRQLLAWQQAQDSLLAEAAVEAFGERRIRLLKNDRDSQGNIYGAQENYEARLATGWRMRLWQTLLVLLLPIVVLTWLMLWVLAGAVLLYTILATLFYLATERLIRKPAALAKLLFGCEFEELGYAAPTGPAWLEATLSVVTRIVTAPLAAGVYLAIWLAAFVRIRRDLLPFLVTRSVFAGSGMLDDHGHFHLADKAPAMNCLLGYGGLLGDRPLFTFGHFFKTIYADAWLNPREYLRLFAARQRLQIALGDSNLAEHSEYLRIGTTLLVLDAIEAGELPRVPQIRRPLKSLRAVCADPTLQAKIPLVGGGSCTAIELQRFYLEACRRFLSRRPAAPAEAHEIVRLWEETLDGLQDDPQSLVGRVDWVTKQFVLQKAGRGASWEARKKIDLKYHELSPDGYFQRLKATGIVAQVLDPSELDIARRNPPAGTPATVRGHYIREFAGGDEPLSANWNHVYIGRGRRAKVVHLSQYRPAPPRDLPAAQDELPWDSDADAN